MSLTDEIIYGDLKSIQRSIDDGEDVDDLDIYGYTPLIETAIVNDADKARVLIDNKADVNNKDLTGGTALHWATENHNIALCQLLLKNGADPNAHASDGKTPLVTPLLRYQQSIKQLLYKHGASLSFAQDYINAKLLGHRFELNGEVHISKPNTKKMILVDYEGFFLEFSLSIITHSLQLYQKNYAAKNLHEYFNDFAEVITSLQIATELIQYQQYTTNLLKHQKRIDRLLRHEPLIIPAGYQGHAISFVKFGNYFAKCDRGANSEFEATVVIYEMTRPERFDSEFVKSIVYRKNDDNYIHRGINEYLGLETIAQLPLAKQRTGNCSWANVEASIPTLLAFLLSERMQWPEACDKAMSLYEQWREWDKDRALEECIQSIKHANKYRRAAKAAQLMSVLFQSCHYEDQKDIRRAEKILDILYEDEPAYKCVLNSYLLTYVKENDTPEGRNLMHILDLAHPRKRKR